MSRVSGVAPGFLLLPAQEYHWELVKKIDFRLPLSGDIDELLKKNATPPVGGEKEFSIFEDNVLLLWELIRVMFADSKYPQLEPDQCLNVVALEFVDGEVIVYGEVIKRIGSPNGA